ncbi:MAG: PIG-L family deacetylase [Bacteroidota bacterium]
MIPDHQRIAFLFAHPDDELYVGAMIRRLSAANKSIVAMYATSGDGAGFPERREAEAKASLAKCGLSSEVIHFLRIPEHQVLNQLEPLLEKSQSVLRDFQPDCLISHDYEGGHEAHDALSFAASWLTQHAAAPIQLYTYPLYHGKPQERQGARFKPSRTDFLTFPLSPEEAQLKLDLIATHASQQPHFEGLKRSAEDYLTLLQAREVLFPVDRPINFSQPPMPEVGYEFHRNGYRFTDFQAAIAPFIKK